MINYIALFYLEVITYHVFIQMLFYLTHWSRVTHIYVSKFTIIGLDNDWSSGRHQAIIWTNAEIVLLGPLGAHLSEIVIEIYIFFHSGKCIWKYRLENGGHFVSA